MRGLLHRFAQGYPQFCLLWAIVLLYRTGVYYRTELIRSLHEVVLPACLLRLLPIKSGMLTTR